MSVCPLDLIAVLPIASAMAGATNAAFHVV